jgi:uncharacterized damage-inducible protein DinB
MTSEELLCRNVLNSWKLVIDRFGEAVAQLSEEQMGREVAPGKNRLLYIVGHLTAVHDRLFPLLGIGERLRPELDEAYITNPDRAVLKRSWSDVNSKLTAAFETFTPEMWLQKHTAVSAEDFAKDPTRNRLAVVISRTNHASFHTGQAALAK